MRGEIRVALLLKIFVVTALAAVNGKVRLTFPDRDKTCHYGTKYIQNYLIINIFTHLV